MGEGKNSDPFWDGLEQNLEREVQKALSEKRRVSGIYLFWRLFFAPILSFCGDFFFTPNIYKGVDGIRNAVRKGVLVFAVNARLYELEKGDKSELNKIRGEWNKPELKK